MPTSTTAPTGAASACLKENAPDAVNIEGAINFAITKADFTIRSDPSKEIATLIAKLTGAGHVVHESESGGYLVCKYGLSRHCADLAELQLFAIKLGVRHG